MENPVEEVKKRIDIVDFIGSFINLKKTGRNFKALCPFHQEKTPSFIVSPERQIWRCFGACGEGGDVIKFLMKWENITFFEALKELAQKTGVRLSKISFEDHVWKKKERFFTMNQWAAEFFQYILHKTKFGGEALDYLKRRKVSLSTIKKFNLGYAPQSWDSLLKFLKKKRFEEEEILENGLIVKKEKGGFYDRFRGRLVFPIRDVRGNILGFSGRILEDKEKEAKYINTPETPIYHKRETLFGIDIAKEAIKKEKNVFVVEGEFDVISPYQHGFANFVAIKGAVLTREQLMVLKRYTEKLTLVLDADSAGEEAVKRGMEEAERLEFELGVVTLDYAKDPDEAVNKDEIKFKKILKKPIPIYDFIINLAKKKYSSDDPFSKKKIGEEVVPVISRISNPIIQSYYVKKISSLLDVSEASIERLMRTIKQRQKQSTKSFFSLKKEKTIDRTTILEKYILSLIFQNKNPYKLISLIFSILESSDFSLPSHQQICQILLDFQKTSKNEFNLSKFISQLPQPLHEVFDEIYLFASTEQEFGSEKINKLAYELKKLALKRKIKEVFSNGEEIDKLKEKRLAVLTRELKEVEKIITTL
ncbi:MAG: DNA primase [Microgenomates group bacterium]